MHGRRACNGTRPHLVIPHRQQPPLLNYLPLRHALPLRHQRAQDLADALRRWERTAVQTPMRR